MNFPVERILILYIPWALSVLFSPSPQASYLIAWAGSFFIMYMTMSGNVRPIPADRPVSEQLMRPVFILQIIFAGYMCTTSIFYFFSVLGYDNFTKPDIYHMVDMNQLNLTAQCQRYYCLAHAAMVTGIMFFMEYPLKQKYYFDKDKLVNILISFALISFPLSEIMLRAPGLSQFYFEFNPLSFITGTLALAFAIPQKNARNILICVLLYLFNFYQAISSGFKEPIITSILVLGIFLYPNYKKVVLTIFVPLLILLFLVLPTFNSVFRANAWSGDVDVDDAAELALKATLDNGADVNKTNWDFLTLRLSEIDMFTKYIVSTPQNVPYYHAQILKQSADAIVPRLFWPSKPSTEDVIMERVYDAGVVYRGEEVSAKPPFIVDAYLSYGPIGIFVFLLAYGAAAQALSCKAEELFGGYILGTAVIFSGLFQLMWRGLSFEFIINVIFWSYITMFVIFRIMRSRNILKEA